MPFLRLTAYPEPSSEIAAKLAVELTRLMAEILHKKAELTAVLIEGTTGTWTIGGEASDRACHLEVSITAGTNSEQQKADFITEAMSVLKKHAGPLHAASYITLREIPATDWGYDGLTQAARR
ncbi:tautomerase family protein [Boseongicola sp. H5]|uniref:tautomerase family protein n=1 Tax=Boseongicola sp. H5 TaxID=2763261 RepID=UPI001D0BCAD3|nr:tautomerase family protein [Boseongicola sp. H5]